MLLHTWLITTKNLYYCVYIYMLIKLISISGPTKRRPPQWPGPHHQSKPKSTCTYRKHLWRNPATHRSQCPSSALASLPHSRTSYLPALSGDPDLLPSCCFQDASSNTLKFALAPNPSGGFSTACEALRSPNPWIASRE